MAVLRVTGQTSEQKSMEEEVDLQSIYRPVTEIGNSHAIVADSDKASGLIQNNSSISDVANIENSRLNVHKIPPRCSRSS